MVCTPTEDLSNSKPGIPRASLGEAHGGAARQDGTPTDRFAQDTTDSFFGHQGIEDNVLNDPSQGRTKESNVNRWGNKARALPAADNRFAACQDNGRPSFPTADQCIDVFFCFYKLFHARHVRETKQRLTTS